jgi:hypothetical protein
MGGQILKIYPFPGKIGTKVGIYVENTNHFSCVSISGRGIRFGRIRLS